MDILSYPANSILMKQLNRSQVLNLIRNQGPISKAQIAEMTKLTFPTVVNIITELTERGIISESGYGTSGGGRKPVLLKFNSNFRYVIAVELELRLVKAMIVNLDAEPVANCQIAISPSSGTETITNQIFQTIDEVIRISGLQLSQIYGIGICSPGPVDHDLGIVLHAPMLKDWLNIPLRDMTAQRYGVLTLLEKDANAATMGELWFGAAKGKENVVNIIVNDGIGGGIIIDKRIYRGYFKGAGEIGHGSISLDGPLCDCGNRGCLETFSSGTAIVRKIREEIERGVETPYRQQYEELGDALTLEFVTNAALDGDYLAINVLNDAARILAVGVSNIINYFNPETIILGGKVVAYYPKTVDIVKHHVKERVLDYFYDRIVIEPSQLGDRADIIGAAAMVIEHLFDYSEQLLTEELSQ